MTLKPLTKEGKRHAATANQYAHFRLWHILIAAYIALIETSSKLKMKNKLYIVTEIATGETICTQARTVAARRAGLNDKGIFKKNLKNYTTTDGRFKIKTVENFEIETVAVVNGKRIKFLRHERN